MSNKKRKKRLPLLSMTREPLQLTLSHRFQWRLYWRIFSLFHLIFSRLFILLSSKQHNSWVGGHVTKSVTVDFGVSILFSFISSPLVSRLLVISSSLHVQALCKERKGDVLYFVSLFQSLSHWVSSLIPSPCSLPSFFWLDAERFHYLSSSEEEEYIHKGIHC